MRKRINIVYGDVNDSVIVDSLVKTHDVVIHLAGVLPPFANVREDLCKTVDYNGTKCIVDAIKNYNPDCLLLYASSTSVYGEQKDCQHISVESKCNIDSYDFYSTYKLKAEDYIRDNIKKYSIFRLAYILADPGCESLIYNIKPNTKMEVISAEDAGYAFVCAIDFEKDIVGKIFNVSGGEKFRTLYKDYLLKIFKTYGLSIRFFSTFVCAEKNYFGGYYDDGKKIDDILHFRSKNLDVYYDLLDKYSYKLTRILPRFFALPFVLKYKNKKNK